MKVRVHLVREDGSAVQYLLEAGDVAIQVDEGKPQVHVELVAEGALRGTVQARLDDGERKMVTGSETPLVLGGYKVWTEPVHEKPETPPEFVGGKGMCRRCRFWNEHQGRLEWSKVSKYTGGIELNPHQAIADQLAAIHKVPSIQSDYVGFCVIHEALCDGDFRGCVRFDKAPWGIRFKRWKQRYWGVPYIQASGGA
jgi:hypothetical protein